MYKKAASTAETSYQVIGVFSTISFARVSSGVTLEGDEKERDDRHAGGRGGGGGSNDTVVGERRRCSAVALWGCWPST